MNLKTLLRANVDRAVALGLVVAGGLLLLLGWIGVSGVALAAEQIPFLISGGLGGMFLVAIGATLWLSADLHDEWSRLDAIESALTALVEAPVAPVQTAEARELLPAAPVAAAANGHGRKGVRVGKTLA